MTNSDGFLVMTTNLTEEQGGIWAGSVIHAVPQAIAAGETIDLRFVFDADKVVRPFYETMKSGRIKKDAVYPGTAKGKELGR